MSSGDFTTILVAAIGPAIALLSGYILLRVKKQKPLRTVEDHLDTFLEALLAENKNLRSENEKKDTAIERRDVIIEKKDSELNYLRAFAANKKARVTEENENIV